jgi:uncharacterized protein (DUF2249 family)
LKKICVNKITVVILAIILSMTLIPISSACTLLLKPAFENIVISSSIEKDTLKPLDEKTEFETSAENIYATVKYSNVKGEDNYRFKWTNLDTGETVLDVENQYAKDKEGKYISGTIMSRIDPQLFKLKIISPGDYKVDYYHKGEVIKTTTFKVTKPQAKIMEVSLANKVDEKYAPVNITKKFSSNETVYACVKFDIQTIGTNVKAKWKSSTDELIFESSIDMTVDYPSPSYISFWFPEKPGPITAGNYKVEIYLNDNLYGSSDFEVTSETAETVEAVVTFDKGNTFTEAQSKYFFTIKYPDNWEYTFTEDNTGMNVGFKSLNKNELFGTTMSVINDGSGIKESDYTAVADEFAKAIAQKISGEMQQIGDTKISDYTLVDGSPFKDYIYYFNDNSTSDKGEYAMIIDLIPKFGKLYVWVGVATKIFYTQLDAAFLGGLQSLVLKE